MLAANSNIRNAIICNIIILTLATAGISTASALLFREEKIYPSVAVAEIDVGLLDKRQAFEKIKFYLETKKDLPLVILCVDGEEWPLYATDLEAQYDIQHLVDNAYRVAREGYPLQRLRERYIVMQQGKIVPFQIEYDTNKLNDFVEKIMAKYNKPPVNASLELVDGHFSITEDQPGRMILSKEQLVDLIMQTIQSGWGHKAEVYVENIAPEIVAQNLQSISQEWASYTTEFDPANRNRTENIILAAQAINGTILKPNDVFSFNQIVGLRSSERGYKSAPVFIQGQLALDAGGGVCQVSSTLYNATLLANLEIVERSSHYRPPLYVPLGLDATVADNALDFRFKNNTTSYLFITSEVTNNRVHVHIFGNALTDRPDVNIATVDKQVLDAKTLIKQDHDMILGQQVVEQQEQNGYIVTTIRVVSQHGKEIKREIIAQDEFTPVEKIIRVGTKSSQQSQAK